MQLPGPLRPILVPHLWPVHCGEGHSAGPGQGVHAAGCSVVGVEGPYRPWGSMELPVSRGATEVFKAENCSSDVQFFQKSPSTMQRWKEGR